MILNADLMSCNLLNSFIQSVQFSRSVMSDSLGPHEPQHTRPPCPPPTPGVYPNPCPLSWWCHSTISSSVIPFSSCLQSFLASGSFQMSQLFASGGQSIGVSASTSVLPMNTQGLISFRMDWLDLLAVQGTLKNLLQHHSSKASILRHIFQQPLKSHSQAVIFDKIWKAIHILTSDLCIFLPKCFH